MTRSRKPAAGFQHRPLRALGERTTPVFPATVGLGNLTAAAGMTVNGTVDFGFAGASVAGIGDVNGDGSQDLVVAAGFGGGPRLALFDGRTIGAAKTPGKLAGDFFVFEPTLRNGVYVAAGDHAGDGFADVIAGGGPQTQVANFFAGNTANRGGVRVVAKDLDGDGRADLVAGAGDNAGSQVTAYAGKDIPTDGAPGATLFQFDAAPGFANGVYVG